MASELETTQKKLSDTLDGALNSAAAIITKSYLEKLDKCTIQAPSAEDLDMDVSKCGKFYKLTKLVYNTEENFLDKLTTIVNVVSTIGCSIVTMVHSEGIKVEYYFGVLSKHSKDDSKLSVNKRKADAEAFHGALCGNLIGSDFGDPLPEAEVERFKRDMLLKKGSCYASVSGIVSIRNENERNVEQYVQGLENLVDSLKGQKYTIVMLADSLSSSELQVIKRGYETLHTQLSLFAKNTITYNDSDTLSLSKAQSTGISEGITKGISMTQSTTNSRGTSFGFNLGGGVNVGMPFAGIHVDAGINMGRNQSTAKTYGEVRTDSSMNTKSSGTVDTRGASKTTGKSLQLESENRSVKALLDKIDRHLERLDECESFGAFDCATYVIADDRDTALRVASNYNALMRGHKSHVQASHVNVWDKGENAELIGRYVSAMVHPRFVQNKAGGVIVTPASIVSGEELAIQIGLPKKSINGITVIPMAPFGRNVLEWKKDNVELGKLYHMGRVDGNGIGTPWVKINVQSLAMHTFITGSTGAGKSTTIYSLLEKLMRQKVEYTDENVKFLVVEPAKGEYKDRFGNYSNVRVYGTNDKITPLLKLNPFSFPEDVHILEHIDRLVEIFNVCWPMYAAMPAVLKDAVERAYEVAGWDLDSSECRFQDDAGNVLFPSFADVLRQINVVMDESDYSADSKGDYKGALCTRLKGLTNGIYGRIFSSDELSGEDLFENNVIIDLSRTGAVETKALIMGLLVMKLQEYRMSNALGGNAPLRHVTVLEEAHHILRRTSTEQTSEGSNLLGKSVEMIANSIAEMRTYGEGFIIADQAPGLLDASAIRNTNTKIILRLPSLEDREIVGRAASLNDEQIMEIPRFQNFVAAVYQNDWQEPVLCKIEPDFSREKNQYQYKKGKQSPAEEISVLRYLIMPRKKRNELDDKYVSELIQVMFRLPLPAETKVAFLNFCREKDPKEWKKMRSAILYQMFPSERLFCQAKCLEENPSKWYDFMNGYFEQQVHTLSEMERKQIITQLAWEHVMHEHGQRAIDFKYFFEEKVTRF